MRRISQTMILGRGFRRFEVVDMDRRRIDRILIERDRDSARADGG
jgi:CBS domain containing-hemolysin-like protein